jgi:hypothetical protein
MQVTGAKMKKNGKRGRVSIKSRERIHGIKTQI